MTVDDIIKSAKKMKAKANEYKEKHHSKALTLKILYYILGGLATTITTITGITVLPNIISEDNFVGSILAFIAAICTVILTFYQLGSKAECHSKVEVLCEIIVEEIELFIDNECNPTADLAELTKSNKKFQLKITNMVSESGKCRTFKA